MSIAEQYYGKVATYLESQIPPLEPQIGGDVLINCPGEFVVKLPCHTTEEDCAESNDARTCQEEPVQFVPNAIIYLRSSVAVNILSEPIDGLFHLRNLYARVDDHAHVIEAQADDLNCVLRAQRIVNQDQLV